MAKGLYIGNENAKKVKKIYLGDSNSRKVKKGYVGVDGIAKLFFSGATVWKKYNAISNNIYYWNRYEILTTTTYTWSQYSVIYTQSTDTVYSGTLGPYVYYSNYLDFDSDTGMYTLPSSDNMQGISWKSYYRGTYIGESKNTNVVYTIINGGAYIRVESVRNPNGTYSSTFRSSSGGIYKYSSTPGPDTFQTYVQSTDANAYPNGGVKSGFWYGSRTQESEQSQGDWVGTATSALSSRYPQNGISGNYWYVYDRVVTTYSRGSYIRDVENDNPNAYPSNGRHTDGYWYVKQSD